MTFVSTSSTGQNVSSGSNVSLPRESTVTEKAPPPRVSPKKKEEVQAFARKAFVLDTNVLLHDPASIWKFADNDVCIPIEVIAELDRFKGESSDRGANAREVHRCLAKVFSETNAGVVEGVRGPNGGKIQIALFDESEDVKYPTVQRFLRVFHDFEHSDHRILATALALAEKLAGKQRVILVSKDLNMQLKAKAVGVSCEDYLNDKVEVKEVSHMELRTLDVTPQQLQRFGSSGHLSLEPAKYGEFTVNEYVLLRAGEKQSMPARFSVDGDLVRLKIPDSLRVMQGRAISPMNLGQACLLDALMNPEINLVTCFGQAGTGKTLLACAAGLSQVMSGHYAGLTVSRPIVAMGQGIGFLPGSLEDKMRPWLQPVYDALDLLTRPMGAAKSVKKRSPRNATQNQGAMSIQASGISAPYEPLVQSGIIEIEALCFIRGRSIPDRFFILDEAQQLTPLEAKTVVTRMSRGSKLILVGDPAQIDNPYVDSRSNGLVYTRQRMKGQVFAAHIPLSKGERSPLAEAGARLM